MLHELESATPREIYCRMSRAIPGAVPGPLPATQSPQLASVTDKPPTADGWISELKWDGYRLIVRIQDGQVRLLTRNGHNWTDRMPSLASRFLDLNVENAMIDGELVALKPDGRDSFHDLQCALSDGRDSSLYFYAFDLLHLNGLDLLPDDA
jgi:bifunctional non-homologous end joining protein LigD